MRQTGKLTVRALGESLTPFRTKSEVFSGTLLATEENQADAFVIVGNSITADVAKLPPGGRLPLQNADLKEVKVQGTPGDKLVLLENE